MGRAMIRVTLRDVSDEKAIELKKAIEKVVEKVPEAEVELSLVTR